MKHTLVTACRRTALLLVALLALSGSLLVTHPAFAATASAHPAPQARPLASGGGCGTNHNITSCISENSAQNIVSDAYASGATLCDVDVELIKDGSYVNDYYYQGCGGSGTRFIGPVWAADPGHSWYTVTCAYVNNIVITSWYCTLSPYLYS